MLMEITMVLNTIIANTAVKTVMRPVVVASPKSESQTNKPQSSLQEQPDVKAPNATKRSLDSESAETENTAVANSTGIPVTKKPARRPPPRDGAGGGPNKAELVLKKLRSAKGATIAMLMETTGWQAHSVRGFLSGTVRKKLGFNLISDIGKDGVRRYRIHDDAKDA